MFWRIELLGGLRIRQGDRVISRFSTQKTGALLAYLAHHHRRAHTREALAELLWPEAAPEVGRHNLRQALLSLRRQLDAPAAAESAAGLFRVDRSEVRLSPDLSTDVAEFEAGLKSAAQAPEPDQRAQALARSVELYQGELLPGQYDEWVFSERQRLAEACLDALRQLVHLCEQAGDLDRAVQYGRRAIAMDPVREEAHCDLMRLYRAMDRPAEALRQFRELERVLREQLDETPSEEATALARELPGPASRGAARRPAPSALAVARAPAAPPAEASPPAAPAPLSPGAPRLPAPLTRFFGREEELERLGSLLPDPAIRLITLTGLSGSGKTRLAIEAARRMADTFEGAIWFVPLANRMDAAAIPEAIAAVLQLQEGGDPLPLPRIAALLDGTTRQAPGTQDSGMARGAFLILDNFEHLIEEGAAVVAELLDRAPSLTVLVTSRQRLEIAREREVVVLPLPVPGVQGFGPSTREAGTASWRAQGPRAGWSVQAGKEWLAVDLAGAEHLNTFPSVQLFVDRARASRPDFAVTPRNAAAVAQLCTRLEGIPLALELAAARAQMLTPSQMLAQLEARFDFLVSRRRDVPPRHRTLRAAIAWSCELLPADLRRFFAQLSVFHGGWKLEGAEFVCADAPADLKTPALEYLTELSDRSLILVTEGDDEMTYRMLETLRDYATEQLAPADRAALRRRHAEYYLSLAERAWPNLHGPDQAAWLDRLEAEQDNFRAALAWCVRAVGSEQWAVGSPDDPASDRGAPLPELPTAHCSLPTAVEIGLRLAGMLHFFWYVRGQVSEGRRWLAELLALPAASGPTAGRAAALYGAAGLAVVQGDLETACALYEESLSIRRALGDREGTADVLCQWGYTAERRGDQAQARALFVESMEICRALHDRGRLAHVLKCIGADALAQGDEEQARDCFEESLALYRELGDMRGIAMMLAEMAHLALSRAEYERAEPLLEEYAELSRRLKDVAHMAMALWNLGYLARIRGEYQVARLLFEESLAMRRELGGKAEIAALLAHLGSLSGMEGEPAAARVYFGEALALLREVSDRQVLAACLDEMASVALVHPKPASLPAGTAVRAVRLLAAAEALRVASGATTQWPVVSTLRGEALEAARAALGDAAFTTAWTEGSAMTAEEAMQEAFRFEG